MQATLTHDPVVRDFLKGIERIRPEIRQLVLFGSRVRGTYRLDSDYDVLVVVGRKVPSVLDVLYESVMDVLLSHGRLVSLKVFEEGEFARLQGMRTPFMKDLGLHGQRIG
jgi:predicted nucleotidyltransferase